MWLKPKLKRRAEVGATGLGPKPWAPMIESVDLPRSAFVDQLREYPTYSSSHRACVCSKKNSSACVSVCVDNKIIICLYDERVAVVELNLMFD
jgi:hypothetical protein